MNRQVLLMRIAALLARFKGQVDILNISTLNDINKIAEDILIPILNEILDINLQNTNAIKKNFKAIDLIDKKNRICFQITSNSSMAKIVETLKNIESDKLYYDYDKFCFVILKRKGNYENHLLIKATQGKFKFSKENIWDIDNLYEQIVHLEYIKIEKIEKFLNNQFSDQKNVDTSLSNPRQNNSESLISEIKEYQTIFKFFPETYHDTILNSINEHDKIVAVLSCAPNYRENQYDSKKNTI